MKKTSFKRNLVAAAVVSLLAGGAFAQSVDTGATTTNTGNAGELVANDGAGNQTDRKSVV